MSTNEKVRKFHKLSLGPVMFNWDPAVWKDFYFNIAENNNVDCIYLGEVTCMKKAALFSGVFDDVVNKILDSGKELIISTLALVSSEKDVEHIRQVTDKYSKELKIEVNDITTLTFLQGKEYVSGQFMSVYNEDTMDFLSKKGARRFCLPAEIANSNAQTLCTYANSTGLETEILAYGRVPLALSSRCYHARAYGKDKQGCQFACKKDPEGLNVNTLADKQFLIINGVQTLSYSCRDFSQCPLEIKSLDVDYLRISPTTLKLEDTLQVIDNFKKVFG